MPENYPADRDRRSFIGDTLRLTAFSALIATGAVLGLRKTSPESRIYRCTNTILPCRECRRYARCEVSTADSSRKFAQSTRLDKSPAKGGTARAKK